MSEGMDHVELENPTISLNLPPQAQENIAQAVSSIAMDGSTMDQELPIGDSSTLGGTGENAFSMEVDQGETIHVNEEGATISDAQGMAVSVLDTNSLQSILAQMQGNLALGGDKIQVITLNNTTDLAALTQQKYLQFIPTVGQVDQLPVLTLDTIQPDADKALQLVSGARELVGPSMLQMPPAPQQKLPPGCPQWAARLRDCQQMGDSFRGWVQNEVELDLLLTYHKQQTTSLWGTRQSPSPGKPSTRLMWKSQYVPFDGIPFINSGSRAIVMECQFGPRRKGMACKKTPELMGRPEFKQTCPARIYIKKVTKFPEFGVDMNLDKKELKNAMDRSFMDIRNKGTKGGEERFYVQLPTEKAHEFHIEKASAPTPVDEPTEDSKIPSRLHPKVAQKIRDLVSSGETRLYAVRKALRRYVERELFPGPEDIPERHNLTYFPTVHDLQNHIFQAIKDIESGSLALKTPLITSVISQLSSTLQEVDAASLWPQAGSEDGGPRPETVTVTLTQNPGEGEQHVISKVETHLSDGSTQISSTLAPETAQLLSKLHPNMFSNASIVQLPTTQPQLISVVPFDQASEKQSEDSVNKDSLHSDGNPIMNNPDLVTTAAEHGDLSGLILTSHNAAGLIDSHLSESEESQHLEGQQAEPGEIVRCDSDISARHGVSSTADHSQISYCMQNSGELVRLTMDESGDLVKLEDENMDQSPDDSGSDSDD